MIHAFKTYTAIFGFISQNSDIVVIDGQKYQIREGKRTIMNILSLIFILFPVLVWGIVDILDHHFDFSALMITLSYLVIYFLISTVIGKIAGDYLIRYILIKQEDNMEK